MSQKIWRVTGCTKRVPKNPKLTLTTCFRQKLTISPGKFVLYKNTLKMAYFGTQESGLPDFGSPERLTVVSRSVFPEILWVWRFKWANGLYGRWVASKFLHAYRKKRYLSQKRPFLPQNMHSWAHIGLVGSFGILLVGWLVVCGCGARAAIF